MSMISLYTFQESKRIKIKELIHLFHISASRAGRFLAIDWFGIDHIIDTYDGVLSQRIIHTGS